MRVRLTQFVLGAAAPLVLASVCGSAPAWCKDEVPNIVWTAKADPEAVGPGGKGVLVLTGTIRKTVHVYADVRFKVKPVAVAGVTYTYPEKSKPTKWVDPELGGDAEEVWFDQVVVKVPFTLAADAKLPLTVAASVEWSCCDKENCFGKETTKPPLSFELRAAPPPKEPPPSPIGLAAPSGAGPAAAEDADERSAGRSRAKATAARTSLPV
jgi:hypothetical protein